MGRNIRPLARQETKDRICRYFPLYSSNPDDPLYEQYCRVKLMLNHPFRQVSDLLLVQDVGEHGTQCTTYAEAYSPCQAYHSDHPSDHYNEDLTARDDDEFEDAPHEEEEQGRSWEDIAAEQAAAEETETRSLGSRDIDRNHDWSPHVGRYPALYVDKTWWDQYASATTNLDVPSQP